MRWLSGEEARELQREWGIDENEWVITFISRPVPAPPPETEADDDQHDEEGDE